LRLFVLSPLLFVGFFCFVFFFFLGHFVQESGISLQPSVETNAFLREKSHLDDKEQESIRPSFSFFIVR